MVEDIERGFRYEGPFYARPVYRGVCLWDEKENPMVDDLIYDLIHRIHGQDSGVFGRMRISVEILSVEGSLRPGQSPAP